MIRCIVCKLRDHFFCNGLKKVNIMPEKKKCEERVEEAISEFR